MRFQTGSIIIGTYASIAFFAHLSLHSLNANAFRMLALQFNATYPAVAQSFEWAEASTYSPSTGMLFGIIGGTALFFTTLLFVNSGQTGTAPVESMTLSLVRSLNLLDKRKDDAYFRDIVAGICVMVVYLTVYAGMTSMTNPYLLQNTVDVFFAFAIAGISGASTFLYIYYGTRSRLRRVWTRDKEVQLKIFELEHESVRQLVQLFMYGMFLMLVGVSISPVSQIYVSLPAAVAASRYYVLTLLTYGLLVLTVTVGFFFGIWTTTLSQSDDILDAITEYGETFDKPLPPR